MYKYLKAFDIRVLVYSKQKYSLNQCYSMRTKMNMASNADMFQINKPFNIGRVNEKARKKIFKNFGNTCYYILFHTFQSNINENKTVFVFKQFSMFHFLINLIFF